MVKENFWNLPLRAVMEIYLDFAFMTLINKGSIGYENLSMAISSGFFVFSGICILGFPFAQLTIFDSNANT